MSEAPERIWLDWPAANRGDVVYDEPPERDTQPGQTEYIRADVSAARIADLERQIAEARADVEQAVALVVQKAADHIRPTYPRPCACTSCNCGNVDDARDVAFWDEATANADAILALASADALAEVQALRKQCDVYRELAKDHTYHELTEMARADAAEAEVARLRAALAVYADDSKWVVPANDRAYIEHKGTYYQGEIARAALGDAGCSCGRLSPSPE